MRIAVIGRGIVGQAIAFELIRKGHEVILIGPQETQFTASRCALGLSSMKGLILPRDPLFRAKFRGHHLFPYWLNSVSRIIGIHKKLRVFRGDVYEPYSSQTERQKICKRAHANSYNGLFNLVEDMEHGTFRYPFDYWFHPGELLAALDGFNTGRSKSTHEIFLVKHIFKLPDGSYCLENEFGDKLFSSAVVLAAGPSSLDILRNSEIIDLTQSLIAGHSLWANADFLIKQTSIFAAASLNFYQGHARFGSSTYQINSFSQIKKEEDLATLLRKLNDLNIAHAKRFDWQPLFGVRSRFSDRLPAIGNLGDAHKNLVLATGLHKNGFALAPLIAKAVSLHFRGFKSRLFTDFSPLRFFRT